jgi:hypothetical protein
MYSWFNTPGLLWIAKIELKWWRLELIPSMRLNSNFIHAMPQMVHILEET